MAHLLGSKYCIESLRKDVSDLHETVIDVFSRAGPVRFQSWKFPDKISADLNINDLLEQYDYSEDEEERQVAHIVLLELVIERMVLLVQSMAKYLEHIFTLGRGTSAVHKGSNMSIGLVVKKYWNKLVQLNTMMSQIQSENKTKTRKIVDLENTVEKLTLEIKELKEGSLLSSGVSPCKTPGFGGLIPPNNAELGLRSHHIDISKDCCNKNSQTDETAFVPCEGCARVQISLKEVGNSVIQLCKSQSLPCSLVKIKQEMENLTWMSSNDVARWTAEQNKDMTRINKQLENLLGTIEPLKSDLEKTRKTGERFKDDLRDSNREVQKEKETQTTIRKQYERKISDIQKENTDILDNEKQKSSELSRTKKELNTQVHDLKSELDKQVEALNELECAQVELRKDLEDSQVSGPRITELEAEVNSLQMELSTVTGELSETSNTLAVEQAKGKSVNKHTQSLQSKQDSLLQRVDELDQENEELKNDVADLEDAKETLEDHLNRVTKEKKILEIKAKENEILVSDLRDGKDALERSIQELKDTIGSLESQVEELKEREKLIVEYPDLNGPVNADFSGTGDIALDMENQVKANSLRIHILEEQNQGLRNSISKMLQLQAQKAVNNHNAQNQFHHPAGHGPTPLWQQNNLDRLIEDTREEAFVEEDHESQPYGASNGGTWTNYQDTAQYRSRQSSDVPKLHLDDRSATDSKYLSNSTFSVGRVPRPPSGTSQKRQVPKERGSSVPSGSTSGKAQQVPLASKSSIAAFLQLKNSGMLKAGQIDKGKYRPMSGTKSHSSIKYDPNYTAQDVLMCPKCDKMYTNQKDLDIHRTYCRS